MRPSSLLFPKSRYGKMQSDGFANYSGSSSSSNETLLEFVSVHRREMEGGCHGLASHIGQHFCVGSAGGSNSTLSTSICDIVYSDTVNMTSTVATNYTNVPMVLFTDGQAKEKDNTFPLRASATFQVEAWMMTLSSVHIGVPVSSVDNVVNHWRRGKNMLPTSCYVSDSFQ
jgi:hypothetical protein